MGIIEDMHALILKYLRDKYPGTYDDMTTDLLRKQPYHNQVWTWWLALAHYGMNGNYKRLEDVPDGLRYVSIMGEKKVEYELIKGKYVAYQEITKEFCKDVYGDKTPGT
jgi:hypothetical protein